MSRRRKLVIVPRDIVGARRVVADAALKESARQAALDRIQAWEKELRVAAALEHLQSLYRAEPLRG